MISAFFIFHAFAWQLKFDGFYFYNQQ